MRISCISVGMVFILFLFLFHPAAAVELTMLASWNQKYSGRAIVADKFTKRVEKLSKGEIKISLSGPEVVPPFEQIQPVSAGVFDLLFSHGIYHFGSQGLGFAVDAVDPDPSKRRAVGIWGFIDAHYQKTNNLRLIGLFPVGRYAVILKDDLTRDGDWKGAKIRGTKVYHGVIRALGGSPVVLPGDEIYSALEKGVADGAAWPVLGPLDFKWYEVARTRVRPAFGSPTLMILMNKDKFARLGPADRKLLLDVARRLEIDALHAAALREKEEDERLSKLGMKVSVLPTEHAEKIARAFAASVWSIAEECCGESAKELRALASKHYMTQ